MDRDRWDGMGWDGVGGYGRVWMVWYGIVWEGMDATDDMLWVRYIYTVSL